MSLRKVRARRRELALEEASENAKPETLDQALGGLTSDAQTERKFNFAWTDAIVQSFHLTPAETHVGSAIASFINMDPANPWYGTGWASQKTIADKLNLTVRTVNSAFQTLRRLGLIVVEQYAGWKYRGARTATHRFALSTRGLSNLRAIDAFERRLLAAYDKCADAESISGYPKVWKRSPQREEIETGKIGNQHPQDRKSFLTTNINTSHEPNHSPTSALVVEYRVLCILIGADRGEEYGRKQLVKLPPTVLRKCTGELADGTFTVRTLGNVLDCLTEAACNGQPLEH